VEAVVVVTQNTYNIWQTLLAFVLLLAAGASGLGWLNRRIAKKDDIEALTKELAAVKSANTAENNRIMSMVGDVKADVKQTTMRLERHIDGKHGISVKDE
jgi:hypothetical protein